MRVHANSEEFGKEIHQWFGKIHKWLMMKGRLHEATRKREFADPLIDRRKKGVCKFAQQILHGEITEQKAPST